MPDDKSELVFDLARGLRHATLPEPDAAIEVGSRMIDEAPGARAAFERVGRGSILNNSSYDLAAPWLCLTEAGGS